MMGDAHDALRLILRASMTNWRSLSVHIRLISRVLYALRSSYGGRLGSRSEIYRAVLIEGVRDDDDVV